MTILLYELVGRDAARPFSPHCWKIAMALAHKGLGRSSLQTRFLDVPRVEGGISKTAQKKKARQGAGLSLLA